jgi:hypothetical protein
MPTFECNSRMSNIAINRTSINVTIISVIKYFVTHVHYFRNVIEDYLIFGIYP